LYEVSTVDATVQKIEPRATVLLTQRDSLFVNSISSDGRYVAYVVGRTFYVDDVYAGETIYQDELEENYLHVGGAVFSPDNTSVAFGATTSYFAADGESSALYVVQLPVAQSAGANTEQAEGEQKIQITSGTGGFYVVETWNEGEEPQYTLLDMTLSL
jgi:hypothetical protein